MRDKAEGGDVSAQINLGVRYADGDGVTKSFKEAVKWFRKAADQGAAQAEYNLGVSYTKGEGVVKDPKAAVNGMAKLPHKEMHPPNST